MVRRQRGHARVVLPRLVSPPRVRRDAGAVLCRRHAGAPVVRTSARPRTASVLDLATNAAGDIEQHGDFLPLITDTVVACLIARRVSADYGLFLLPPVTPGDALRALKAGVLATDPSVQVNVNYIGSFSDVALASELQNRIWIDGPFRQPEEVDQRVELEARGGVARVLDAGDEDPEAQAELEEPEAELHGDRGLEPGALELDLLHADGLLRCVEDG